MWLKPSHGGREGTVADGARKVITGLALTEPCRPLGVGGGPLRV